MRFSKSLRRALGLRGKMIGGAAIAVCIGVLGFASVASAAPHNPKGEFAAFGDCPLSNPKATICIYSLSNGGSFTIGLKTVPLKNPVTLQGGLEITNPELFEGNLVAAEDGNTLSKTPQPVPGGLLGITAPTWWPQILKDLFNETINNGFTGVNATVELAAPASKVKVSLFKILGEQGTALSLPVKIKLDNPFLGSSCYVGSNSSPITINFTTGTTSPPPPNVPIKGAAGSFFSNEAGSHLTLTGGRLVDNAFSAPGANGCGGFLFSWAVDPLVNSILGTPAPAGKNTAILEGELQAGEAAAVKASE